MRFTATLSTIACSGVITAGLIASAFASDRGYYAAGRASPHVIEASDIIPAPRARHSAARHFIAQGRQAYSGQAYGGAPLSSYGGVFYRANGERRYEESYRPAAYNAADAYPAPLPPAHGYIVVVAPPYPTADYVELTGYQPLPHIIQGQPAEQSVCPCDAPR